MQNGIVPVPMFCEQRQTDEDLGSNKTYRIVLERSNRESRSLAGRPL